MTKIAHVINPVRIGPESDLHTAQPITFASLRAAREYARGSVDVELFSAQYAADRDFVPEWLTPTRDLDRSVLDCADFKIARKLPILKDILDRLYEVSDADYFVYTNVDIALMPHFYCAIAGFIDAGYDTFVVNRRTISDRFCKVAELPLMYSEIGKRHPGHDCFVFPRAYYPKFRLAEVCIGINWICRVLILNLLAHGRNFCEFRDKHLTFHIGETRVWRSGRYTDYQDFNRAQAERVLKELEKDRGPFPTRGEYAEYSNILKGLRPNPLLSDWVPSLVNFYHAVRRALREIGE